MIQHPRKIIQRMAFETRAQLQVHAAAYLHQQMRVDHVLEKIIATYAEEKRRWV
jgi:hypothetical protein